MSSITCNYISFLRHREGPSRKAPGSTLENPRKRSVFRLLLCFLFGVAVSAGAFLVTNLVLGVRDMNPLAARVLEPAWPLPESTQPHPLWTRFPDLRCPDGKRRTAILTDLLRLERRRLPHPARKPGSWDLSMRIQAHALLWRLYRGRGYRVSGLELRLEGPKSGSVVAGTPANIRLVVEAVYGRKITGFPADLGRLLEAGGRLHVIARQGKAPVPAPAPGNETPMPPSRPVTRGQMHLHHAPLERAVFPEAGTCSLVVALDLTDVDLEKTPQGILVSNALEVRVTGGQ